MIPKVLHCIWLSGDPKPDLIRRCIESWKRVLPDFEIREWSMASFDMNAMPAFVQEAVRAKKWAFATDYLRLYVLYHEGGVYLDLDIFLKRDITAFLEHDYFSFVEYHPDGFAPYRHLIDENGSPLTRDYVPGFSLQAAFFGATAGHPFLQSCMAYYEKNPFLTPDGQYATRMIAPDIYALCARDYGFRYLDKAQSLSHGVMIYPSSYVAGCFREIKANQYAIHCCAGSWRDDRGLKKICIDLVQGLRKLLYLR